MTLMARALAILALICCGGLGGDVLFWHSAGSEHYARPQGASLKSRMLSISAVWSGSASSAKLTELGHGKGIVWHASGPQHSSDSKTTIDLELSGLSG